jgi:hypothetical protein
MIVYRIGSLQVEQHPLRGRVAGVVYPWQDLATNPGRRPG